ncbi:Ubiquitin carboxyl-terminal hydrolase 48 [Vanrija pseudolonga]|uniref:Ubiquitin carboxyl-terminal hydrolase n=1 Tax=Vanrija pseudolonga TaxID=143232 RepID=A0AAF0YGV6_9TREE|nr:Ubiquitin carboxyl-terminal hydrolase 48 [Vanrija pseudolonga]
MPPKSGYSRHPKPDWSWAGREVKRIEEITPEHRRRAAGVAPDQRLSTCRFVVDAASREATATVNDGNSSDSSLVFLKEETCTLKKCKSNPWCLNHLGAKEWASDGTRQEYIDDKLGPEIVVRDGPAGLKNYGATCYANAFLQVWFHNVAFRNGVYAAVGTASALQGTRKSNGSHKANGPSGSASPSSSASSTTIGGGSGSEVGRSNTTPPVPLSPLHHLANIFAMMHYSNKPVVDPGALIEALRLNKGDQQDAAEFSKLFMSLLSDEFKRHGALKTFVSDHFEGVYEYQTRCQTCGYMSRNQSTFLELEISLQDKKSLQDRLAHLLTPEVLSGSNQYRCPDCESLQDATRSTILRKLPPVLHFSLLRFVYDPNSGTRKKSKASITYPRELKLGDDYYDLRGVVSHQGTSAFHGHFTCEVYDEDLKEWFFTSDEQVEKLTERQKANNKRLKLDPDVVEEQVSKDAYMFVYKRREMHPTPQDKPPASMLEALDAENAAMQAEIHERDPRRAAIAEEFDALFAAKISVLAQLRGEDKLVPRDSLRNWIKSRDLDSPWDYTGVTCEHGNIDPAQAGDLRLISQAAFDQLKEYSAELAEDRTLRDIDICAECVAAHFSDEVQEADHNAQVREFDQLNNSDDGVHRYAVPLDFVKDWRKRELSTPSPMPSDVEYSLFCEHGRPWGKKKVIWASGAALMFLRSIFGEFDAYAEGSDFCDTCEAKTQANVEARKVWKLQVKEEKSLQSQLNMRRILDVPNYMMPKNFANVWRSYLENTGPRAKLEPELCRHNLLDFDPQVEPRDYMTEDGWIKLCQLYGHDPQDAITAVFTSAPPEGKTCSIDKVSVATCEECRKERLSNFEEMQLTIVMGLDTVPTATKSASSTRSRRIGTTRNKQTQLDVKKNTSVKDIKVELYPILGVGPLHQQLYYRGRELASDETVESIGLLAGDHLNVVEIVEVEDFEAAGEEGFGGTALVGRLACPACTYSNEPDAEMCIVCETAFLS